MALWFYDHRDSGLVDFFGSRTKTWEEIDERPDYNGELYGQEDIPVDGDALIVHDENSSPWVIYARKNPKIQVIFVTVGNDNGVTPVPSAPENFRTSELPWKPTNGELQCERLRKFLSQLEEEHG